MIAALASHIYLLLTLRHPMSGMPKTPAPFFALLLLSVAVAGLRWASPVNALGMLVMLIGMSLISPRLAAAYALISVGIDAMAIPFGDADLFGYWEAAASSAAALRCASRPA